LARRQAAAAFIAWRLTRKTPAPSTPGMGRDCSKARMQEKAGARRSSGLLMLALDPQSSSTLYVAAIGSGVFKSTDGGASWTAVNSGLPTIYLTVNTLVVDPQNPRTVYAGVAGDSAQAGVFKTTDGGISWSALNSGLTTLSVSSLAIDPQDAQHDIRWHRRRGCR